MLQVPVPDLDERRDNAAFTAVLDALARPGLIRDLPEPGPMVVARALIDRECRAAVHDPDLHPEVAALGTTLVPPELACHAVEHAADAAAITRLARLPVGSALPAQPSSRRQQRAGHPLPPCRRRQPGLGKALLNDPPLPGIGPTTPPGRVHLARRHYLQTFRVAAQKVR